MTTSSTPASDPREPVPSGLGDDEGEYTEFEDAAGQHHDGGPADDARTHHHGQDGPDDLEGEAGNDYTRTDADV